MQRDGLRPVLNYEQSVIRIHEGHDATQFKRTSFQELFPRETPEMNDVGNKMGRARGVFSRGEKGFAHAGPKRAGQQTEQASRRQPRFHIHAQHVPAICQSQRGRSIGNGVW